MSANNAIIIAEFKDSVFLVTYLSNVDVNWQTDKIIYDPMMTEVFHNAVSFLTFPEAKMFAQSKVKRLHEEGIMLEYGILHHKYNLNSTQIKKEFITQLNV